MKEQVKEKIIIGIDFLRHFVYFYFSSVERLARYFKQEC